METFSSKDIVARYISDPNLQSVYLEDIYKYLIKRKYFKIVRQLIEDKVPTLYDVVLSPPNSISDTLLQMIQHPLKLLQEAGSSTGQTTVNTDLVNLIVSSFIEEILVPAYTPAIHLFLIPCLANNGDFPFLYLVKYMGEVITIQDSCDDSFGSESAVISPSNLAHFDYFESSYLLNSFLKFDHLHFDQMKQNNQLLCDYVRILARLSNNIRKLPRSSAAITYRLNDYDADEYDSSDSSSNEGRRSGARSEYIPRQEQEALTEAIVLINEQRRAELIVDNTGIFLNNGEVLHSLCKICHNLMLYHRLAIFEYK